MKIERNKQAFDKAYEEGCRSSDRTPILDSIPELPLSDVSYTSCTQLDHMPDRSDRSARFHSRPDFPCHRLSVQWEPSRTDGLNLLDEEELGPT